MNRFFILGGMLILILTASAEAGCNAKTTYPHRVSSKEASEILGASLPVPSYLPVGFSIAAIYEMEQPNLADTFAVTFYPGGTTDTGPLNVDSAPIRMYLRLFRAGQVGGLKLIGTHYDINGNEGILVEEERSNDLWWILPYSKSPGQYEMSLRANKDISEEELVKMARSVPQ